MLKCIKSLGLRESWSVINNTNLELFICIISCGRDTQICSNFCVLKFIKGIVTIHVQAVTHLTTVLIDLSFLASTHALFYALPEA